MMQSRLRSAFVTTALLFFAACSSTSNSATGTNAAAMANAKCPVSGESLAADSPTTTFDGKTIGFCCNNCMKKFDGMSAADKSAKVTGSMPMK